MLPSAREVEQVVLATLKRGNWARAVMFLAGALQLPCVPTARTYTEVVEAVSTRSTWKVAVQILDRLQTSPLSARALYHTAADAMLTEHGLSAPESLFGFLLAARRRRVPMGVRHHIRCSHLLLDSGNWHAALLVVSQERLIQHVEVLAQPAMLAAAIGRQWVAASKVMSSILASGGAPSGAVTESFIRCFTPDSPWWRALAVASVLPCRDEPDVKQRACELREEVSRNAEQHARKTEEERCQVLLYVSNPRLIPGDITLGKARKVLSMLEERHWERALDLFQLFPALLELDPPPRALLSPMTMLNGTTRSFCYWEALWQSVSRSLASAPVDGVLSGARQFLSYVRAGEHDMDGKKKLEQVAHAKRAVISFLNARRIQEGGALDPAILHSFVRSACALGCWEDALSLTERPTMVFTELVESCNWQATIAVYGAMKPSAKEGAGPQLEHMFISKSLWRHALCYAQSHLPEDTVSLRSLAIPLSAALGQWSLALRMLFRYVPSPTAAEKLLQRHCIVQCTEERICEAFESGDWLKALQAWGAICQFLDDRPKITSIRQREVRQEKQKEDDGHIQISPRTVKCIAKLLFDHYRYDECCLVISLHKPTAADPVILRCLQLFYYIRLSPLSYGRILQQYKEKYAPYRVVLDLYAVIALSVSGNHSGAFWILQKLASSQHAEEKNAIARGLNEVHHVKQMISSILIHEVKPVEVVDVEIVMKMLFSCVTSIGDVDLFNEPLMALWKSDSSVLRESALRLAVKFLPHMKTRELPVPWAILRIVKEGLESFTEWSSAAAAAFVAVAPPLLYEAALQRIALDTNEHMGAGTEEKCDGSSRPSQEETDALFRRCAEAFVRMGSWDRALDAMQHCKVADETALFRIVVLLKEEKDRRLQMAHRVILESMARAEETTETSRSKFVPGRQTEELLLTLTQLQAWKPALMVFNSSITSKGHWLRGTSNSFDGGVVSALLSCVAVSGPWETALQLLRTVQQKLLIKDNNNNNNNNNSPLMEKGLTDVLRSVRRHGGAFMCSKVLLFMLEEMGIVPTPFQYEVLLSACLDSRLTAMEREVCARNLRRLSHSLNERQVIDLIVTITTFSRSSEEEEVDDDTMSPFAAGRLRQQRNISRRPHPSSPNSWMPIERPHLNDEEFNQLCHLAVQIILATSRGLEKLSKEAFAGRFRPFELKLLLQHYRTEVLSRTQGPKEGTLAVDVDLVEYSKENQLLHILLLPYEHAWKRMTSSLEDHTTEGFIDRLRIEVFHEFATHQTVAAIWEACHPFVAKLAMERWPWICEYELLRAVRRREGKPPVTLRTRPDASRANIASYWATYGRVIWPELFFGGPELCQLAVYVPLVEPLLGKERKLRELVAGIQAAHFSSESIPQGEKFLRQPRSVTAIHAVFNLAFKTLKRLHTQLDMDSHCGRYYYYHHPDDSLWKQYSSAEPMKEGLPRWALALRIIHQYRRSTATVLPPRMLAALFFACASETSSEGVCASQEKQNFSGKMSWWELAIQCAQGVEPEFTTTLWRHAMHLVASLPTQAGGEHNVMTSEEYSLEHLSDASLQATTRVLLTHAKRTNGTIPLAVSLLLIDQVKELLDDTRFPRCAQDAYMQGEDVLTLWALLQTHRCLEKMNPLHAALLKRLLFEGSRFGGDVT